MDTTTKQIIPVAHRTHWMFDRHIKYYGKQAQMVNLDQFGDGSYLEYYKDDLSHLAEFKNELELIEMWNWTIKNQAQLATRAQLPFFIVVGYQKENCFWVIPANQMAKDLPWATKWCNKWISETNYVKMLYWLRKMKVPQDVLSKLDTRTPILNLKPNIQY